MKHELEQAIAVIIKNVFSVDIDVVLTRPDEQFGDFATNVALQLTKHIEAPPSSGPRGIATVLSEHLKDHEYISDVSVAGPGFLNIALNNLALWRAAQELPNRALAGKKILIEYSDPNPFKPLHAGHLYTTLVGDMIARLTEQAGAETIRLNFGGDVGLHVGKSMWAIIQHLGGEIPDLLLSIPEDDRPSWLGERYVEGNNAYENDEAARKEIINCNKRVYELHIVNDHDSSFARLYWTCREWSYDYFSKLYTQLNVVPFDRFIPESEVTPLGLQSVHEQVKNGIYEESDGAIIFDGEKHGLHKRVFINSEGLPTYETKDVGLSLTKWNDYHFDESIIITATEQAQYMQVVLKSIEQFAKEPAERTVHLTHGTVKLQGGVKMSSRKGNVVTALEILESARKAGVETNTNPNEDTILSAVKYAFAKHRVGSDILYDPVESIALEGNSGPYLQYAHARARSILRKTTVEPVQSDTITEGERSLIRKLSEYSDIIERATEERMPHTICTYLYELSQIFNRFYEHNRVIGDNREAARLYLVQLYADTLKAGLQVLGIVAPEKM